MRVLVAGILGVAFASGILLVVAGTGAGVRTRGSVTPSRESVVRLASALVVAAVVGLLTRWPVGAALAGLAAWSLPGLLGADRRHREGLARTEAIASWAEMLRDTLTAASGLEQAVTATASLAPEAIRRETTELADALRAGHSLPVVLRAWRERIGDPTGELVLRALEQAAQRQSRHIGDLLAELAKVARDRAALRMRVAAGRARIRTATRVITGTTLVLAGGLVLFNRPYLAPYDTVTGQAVLLVVGALFAVGFWGLGAIAARGSEDA